MAPKKKDGKKKDDKKGGEASAEMTEKEYEVYVRETNWHRGMVTAVSEEDAVEKAPHVCLSFYTNGKQVREVRKLMGRLDSEDEVVDMSGLTVYEIMRLERIKRNRAKLRELGLL